jgi:serine/threonine-protein kinase
MEAETHTELPWDLLAPPIGGLSIGIVLQGTYRIVRPLAEGGCGEVYLAAHTRLPGRFAIKLLHRSLVRDSDAFERFRHEAEITSTLRHPHIVQVFDFNVTDGGVPYLVMELLEGKLLAQRMAAGALEPAATVEIVEQIASALHAAHSRGIVHRDLKPENVMLLSGAGVADFVKVLDFGISQASWRPRLTEGERVAGTPQFMSPEQACGLRDQIDHRSDQFSLAAITYALLTGEEPFRGENAIAVLYQVVHADPPPPSQLVSTLGPEIDAVVMRGLAKESADRYPTVLEFASALRAAVHGAAATAFTEAVSEPPPVRTPTPVLIMQPAPAEPPRAESLGAVPLQTVPPEPVIDDRDDPRDDPSEILPAPIAVGRNTVRLMRRMRWRQTRLLRGYSLAAVATLVALAWFLPATRVPTRAAWQRAGAQARIMVERVLPSREIRP